LCFLGNGFSGARDLLGKKKERKEDEHSGHLSENKHKKVVVYIVKVHVESRGPQQQQLAESRLIGSC
jgi:hypothetical protein